MTSEAKKLEKRVKEYEVRIFDALRYADWCHNHADEVDVAKAFWNVRLLLLGYGRLALTVEDASADILPPPDVE